MVPRSPWPAMHHSCCKRREKITWKGKREKGKKTSRKKEHLRNPRISIVDFIFHEVSKRGKNSTSNKECRREKGDLLSDEQLSLRTVQERKRYTTDEDCIPCYTWIRLYLNMGWCGHIAHWLIFFLSLPATANLFYNMNLYELRWRCSKVIN